MKKICSVLLLSVLGICACQKEKSTPNKPAQGGTTVTKSIYDEVIDFQVAYILGTQLPSGAIMETAVPNSRISPYFADISCSALLRKPTPANVDAVKKWMVWYMGKLNGDKNPIKGGPEVVGSVYEYYGAAETTKGEYDAVDSGASTFLVLAMDLAQASPSDKAWLAGYADKLRLVAGALEKCLDIPANNIVTTFGPDNNDGLSIDSYVNGAKYLMDNAEVNQGLRAMVWLETNVLNGDATHYQALLTTHTAAMDTQLWRGTMYNWFENGSTGATISQWKNFYADAVGQLFPGMLGAIDPQSARAKMLYTGFNKEYPAWSTGTVYLAPFPHTEVLYAAAVINDKPRVDEYLNHILSFNRTGAQKPSWYNAEAAWVIMSASKMKNQGSTPVYKE
jgi:hypothetical protein